MCLLILKDSDSRRKRVLAGNKANDLHIGYKIIDIYNYAVVIDDYRYKKGWNRPTYKKVQRSGGRIDGGVLHFYTSLRRARAVSVGNITYHKVVRVYYLPKDLIAYGVSNEACAKRLFIKSLDGI